MKLKNKIKRNYLMLMFLILLALFDCYQSTKLLTKEKFEIMRHRNENSRKLIADKTNNLMKVFFNRDSPLKDNELKYKEILVPNTSTSFLQLENRNAKDVCEEIEERKESLRNLIHVLNIKAVSKTDLLKIDSSNKAPDTIYTDFINDFTVCIKSPSNKAQDYQIDMKEPPIRSFEALLPAIRTCMEKSKLDFYYKINKLELLFEPKCENVEKLKEEFIIMIQRNMDSKLTENMYFTKPSKNLKRFFNLLQKCPSTTNSNKNNNKENYNINNVVNNDESLKKRIKELEDENTKLKNDIEKLSALKQKTENCEKINNDQLALIEKCTSEKKELLAVIEVKTQRIVVLENENKTIKDTFGKVDEELKKLKIEFSKCKENTQNACKSDLEKLQGEINKLNNSLQECSKKNSDLTNENTKLKTDIKDKDHEIIKLNTSPLIKIRNNIETPKIDPDRTLPVDTQLRNCLAKMTILEQEINLLKNNNGNGIKISSGGNIPLPTGTIKVAETTAEDCLNDLKQKNELLTAANNELTQYKEINAKLTKDNEACKAGWELSRKALSECQTKLNEIHSANKVCINKTLEMQKQIDSKNEENKKINDELIKCKDVNECEKRNEACAAEKEVLNNQIRLCNTEKKKIDLPSIREFISLMNTNEKECGKLKEIDEEIKRVCFAVRTRMVSAGNPVSGTIMTYRDNGDSFMNRDMYKHLNKGGEKGL